MNKEIRIINYVFKLNNKISLLSIEEYRNYSLVSTKIKFLIDNEYIEKEVEAVNHSINKLIFGDLIIEQDKIECYIGKYHLNLNVNNTELLNEYQKTNNKNNYKLFNVDSYDGIINDSTYQGKIYLDYEVFKTIPDEYYKLYTIDFVDFNGSFNFVCHDGKASHINLNYKDEEFKNKKILNVHKKRFFKLSNIKLKCSGNYLWTINININKSFKSNPSIIPFKYQKNTVILKMKKNLFKTDLKAMSKDNLLITYKYK